MQACELFWRDSRPELLIKFNKSCRTVSANRLVSLSENFDGRDESKNGREKKKRLHLWRYWLFIVNQTCSSNPGWHGHNVTSYHYCRSQSESVNREECRVYLRPYHPKIMFQLLQILRNSFASPLGNKDPRVLIALHNES